MSFLQRLADIFTTPFVRLYTHRETIMAFVRRDIRGRYITSVLGFSWAVIQPITLLLLYTFIFSYILQIRLGRSDSTASFSAYLFCGLLPWFAFSEGVTRSASVILENTNLIKKVVFPSEILPAYVVVSAIATEMIGLAIFIIAISLFYVGLSWHSLLLVVVIVLQFLFTMGLGWLVSSLNVFLRDVAQALGLFMTTWMFMTPIFYSKEMIPERFSFILFLNPLYYLVQSYRDLLLNQKVPPTSYAIVLTLFALATFVLGHYFFSRSKKAFVDVI